ncbi:phiSA1p31-related protein [Streptomyces umbrinus]|uniref:phiSA1p31-related protein n=1 Tax=Streptomyces umbrinus TaxID=67370 RepID=UPI0034389085
MSFAVGAKVEHRTFGAGEVAFGPFDHSTGPNHYLIKQEGGKHALVVAEALSPAAKFKVGDRVKGQLSGTEYTIEAGPFFSPREWYATKHADGTVTQNGAGVLSLIDSAADDSAVKVGDVIRILKDGAFAASVKAGDLFEVKSLNPRIPGRIVVDAGPGARMSQWNFRPQDFVKVSADKATVHDGTVYDLTAQYRDTDGDHWSFKRVGDAVRGDCGRSNIDRSSRVGGYSERLSSVVSTYGPLTKV